jgi:U3 small nucleolar RNA-associated protein 12
VELSCRTAALLLRLHHAQLVAAPSARPALIALQARLRPALQGLKDVLGFNMAGIKHLQRAAREAAGVDDVEAAARLRAALGADAGAGAGKAVL